MHGVNSEHFDVLMCLNMHIFFPLDSIKNIYIPAEVITSCSGIKLLH